jgi:predicted RNA binding protein YcfA (HicA-like mRNA interferase family)
LLAIDRPFIYHANIRGQILDIPLTSPWPPENIGAVPPLPIVSAAECIAALRRFGYEVARQRRSHLRLTGDGRRPVTVAGHKGKTLKRGTLAAILRTAEISVDDFLIALKS